MSPGRLQTRRKFSLDAIIRAQATLAAAALSGRSAETVYGGHKYALRQTEVALTEGPSLDEHESPDGPNIPGTARPGRADGSEVT
jgi:hypothetical protein